MPDKTIYHRMKYLNACMAANYRRGFGPSRVVLLLTTTGRKSGLLRMKRHPIMVRLIMHLFDRVPLRFSRAELEEFCQQKALVILHLKADAARERIYE